MRCKKINMVFLNHHRKCGNLSWQRIIIIIIIIIIVIIIDIICVCFVITHY